MITFKLAPHDIRGVEVIEILGPGNILLGVLYPQDWGVRLVSKYLREENIEVDPRLPPVLNVKLP